ncbi:hypothetical protein BO78DRAFT_433647 [Aspergillus sclerotiicarbonarius CBS 121057]|uniref:F-box domain-containing protein n=1 Tax=Aspergillus sclerotiicarbonarius (strain CBS 121057 / IBT 28362) TaxID=1448318 RepID=A0A319ECE9_ASPSB|nr:hypothetical protein BO78DRAFT_433647 [Aspergillus sclerotiicarbonarius CBS 121057]
MPLTALPVEVRLYILGYLDDLRSLEAAIFSSKAFRVVYEHHGNSVLKSMLRNTLGSDLLPLAILHWELSQTRWWEQDPALAHNWLNIRFDAIRDPGFIWTATVEQKRDMLEFFDHVRFLADDYMNFALDRFNSRYEGREMPASRSEKDRVVRCLYLQDILIQAIASRQWDPTKTMHDVQLPWKRFVSSFELWEIEQLAYMNEWVFSIIPYPPMLDMRRPRLIELSTVQGKDLLTHHGLALLREVRIPINYAHRHQIQVVWEWYTDLKAYSNDICTFLGRVGRTADVQAAEPRFKDDDAGPRKLWAWARADPKFDIDKLRRGFGHRRYGCLVLDEKRLARSRLMEVSRFDEE